MIVTEIKREAQEHLLKIKDMEILEDKNLSTMYAYRIQQAIHNLIEAFEINSNIGKFEFEIEKP